MIKNSLGTLISGKGRDKFTNLFRYYIALVLSEIFKNSKVISCYIY